MISKSFCAIISTVLIAYLYSKWKSDREIDLNEMEKGVIEAWQNEISQPNRKFTKLLVGLNANVDLIVPGVPLLKALDVKPGAKVDHAVLSSLDDFQETFAHFFAKGSAAERTFQDADVFQKIVESARNIPSGEWFTGGNAALMANTVAEMFPDVKIHFIGPVGPKLQELFSPSISIPMESNIPVDEVHLIMEYKVGEKWGDATTPVATRFISSYDESNAKITMLETFFENLKTIQPDLVLFSGLHMMDAMSKEFFTSRVNTLTTLLKSVPVKVPVHLELASMANKELQKLILAEVLPKITSLGLNEQELAFSSHVAGGPHQGLFTEASGQPDIHKISDMMLWLLKTYGYSKNNPKSKFTRVHFHSLTYHIVGVLPAAWKNSKNAVAAGTQIAGQQSCDLKIINPEMVDLRIPLNFKLFSGDSERTFDSKHPIMSWSVENFEFSFSPVLVCKVPVKTVGLGDAISSTGLMYSEYNPGYLN